MTSPFVLVTLDYPPERGGVARYLGELVRVSEGQLSVVVPETHATTGPGTVRARRLFAPSRWSWRPMIRVFRDLAHDGHQVALVSHVLPVGTAASIARWFGGIPYVVLVHGLDIRLASQRPHRRWLAGWVLRRAACVVANSGAVAAEVQRLWPELTRVEVLTPAVEPRTFFSKEAARTELGIAANERLLLTVARLVPRKGIDMAIRLLERHPDWRYVVIGSGVDEARLRDLADMHAPGRVQFLTSADDAARDLWFAASDVFVFLARENESDVEGFGIAPLEASQAGLPVLAGNSGGVCEAVVDEVTGILVDPNHLQTIEAGFVRLANDEALRQRLGEAGKCRVADSFRWPERWHRMKALLDAVV